MFILLNWETVPSSPEQGNNLALLKLHNEALCSPCIDLHMQREWRGCTGRKFVSSLSALPMCWGRGHPADKSILSLQMFVRSELSTYIFTMNRTGGLVCELWAVITCRAIKIFSHFYPKANFSWGSKFSFYW